ncbi:hypothetical protein GCK32_011727 [Trichostrongylus colubriformis]|uniref:Uncharacterized protein n=1 Tax=Trichostrongylus colubriformis TaxID=6319 RepID=A0AAN8IB38_TRICO
MDYVQKDKMTVIIIGCGVALVLIAIFFVIIFILMDHAKQKRKKKLKEKMDKEKEERRKKRKAAASHAKKKSSRKSRKRKKEDSSSSSSSHRKRKRQEIEKKKSHDNVKKAVADYLESQLQTCLLAPAQDNETPNMGMSPADADYFATPTPGARPRLGDTPVEVPSSPQNQPPGNAAQNEQRPPVDSVQLGY